MKSHRSTRGPSRTSPPLRPVSALVDESVLTITFDAALQEGGEVGAAAFAVNQAAPLAAAASGAVLTLTLSAPVGEGEEVTARYIRPADAALLDSAGGRVKSFELTVENKTDTAPTAVAALVDATSVEITFDQELSPTATPVTAFSVSDSEGPIAVDSVAVSGRTVSLTLARSAEEAAVVQVAYSRPPTEALGRPDRKRGRSVLDHCGKSHLAGAAAGAG